MRANSSALRIKKLWNVGVLNPSEKAEFSPHQLNKCKYDLIILCIESCYLKYYMGENCVCLIC